MYFLKSVSRRQGQMFPASFLDEKHEEHRLAVVSRLRPSLRYPLLQETRALEAVFSVSQANVVELRSSLAVLA